MDFDHYDLFNAPQYIDFNEFVKNDGLDNDNADEYFETHKEEDDFFVPLESISPSLKSENLVVLNQSSNSVLYTSPEPVLKNMTNNPMQNKPTASLKENLSEASENHGALTQYSGGIHTSSKPELKDITNTPMLNATSSLKGTPGKIMAIVDCLKTGETTMTTTTTTTEDTKCLGDHLFLTNDCDNSLSKKVDHGQEYHNIDCKHDVECTEQEPPANNTAEVELEGDNAVVKDSENGLQENGEDQLPEEEIKVEPVVVETPVPDQTTTDGPKSTCTTQQFSGFRKSIKPPTLSIHRKIGLPSKVTIPQPFNFSTLRQRKIPEPIKDSFNFKARPVPLKVLQGDLVKIEKPVIKTTQPITIHFASDDRIRERQLRKSAPSPIAQTDNERRSRSNSIGRPIAQRTPTKEKSPVPTLDVATSTTNMVQRSNSTKKNTSRLSERSRSPSVDRSKPIVIQPFSFEERDKEMLRKKDEKIRKAIKEETKSKQFHAQPLPNYAVALKRLPKKNPAPHTHSEPFKLKSDQRGINYQEEMKRKIEDEKYRLKLQAEFKAQPNEVIYKKPFEPEKSSVPLAEPVDLLLNTDRRANEREKYQQMIKEKEAELDDLRRKEQTMKEEQEKKMTQVLRQLLVHKARPAPKQRVFEVRASEKPLTDPKSPAFELLPSQRRPRPLDKENY